MTTKTNAPGYARFTNALLAQFRALDIPLVPAAADAIDGFHGPSGWALFEVEGTGDKVYLKRNQSGDPTAVETTVPFDQLPPSLIAKDMRSRNGKIEARVLPDVAALASGLLPVLKSRRLSGERLRASKAPVRKASGSDPATASGPVARVGSDADIGA